MLDSGSETPILIFTDRTMRRRISVRKLGGE
jgi:hypothetical protein